MDAVVRRKTAAAAVLEFCQWESDALWTAQKEGKEGKITRQINPGKASEHDDFPSL